jgi:predicted dehydrogenase
MDKIRIGIIGMGYWGPNILRNLVALSDVEVVAVADLRQERLNYVRSLYPRVEVTTDYEDFFLMELDAAAVVTPPATHFAIGMHCLNEGLHTFIEKPITLSSRDTTRLIQFAEDHHLVLMVGHTYEYNPAVRKVRDIVHSGELGQVYYINTERLNLGLFQADLDVIWDLAPHDISILNFILGKDPVRVSARGGECIFEGKHDIAFIYLEYPEQVITHIHLSWLDPCKVRRTTVVGSQKMLVYDDVESLEKIRIYDKGVEHPPYTHSYGDFQCSYRYGDITIPHIQFTEPLKLECQHFIECIRNPAMTPISSGRQGLKVVSTIEAAHRSLYNGGGFESIEVNSLISEEIS